ncbi:hypothetical protein EHQ58_02265 [Leptospira ognonensis]|uniref:Uncharacterized protein n=1 Tax=Leptospira ognonensis TaxID=2484945 RepID=A0A4R9KC69_9LEPT|nr:hypothetical protein [Leptospira ognonensis]TGL62711.1 hypothetical protein EHQ58_02265 [Leptospira ognonensis]
MTNRSEIESQVKKYLQNPALIQKSHESLIFYLFHTPMGSLIPKFTELPPSTVYQILSKKNDRVKTAMEFDLGSAFPYATLAEGMEKETGEAIANFVSSIEVYPSKKLLVDLLGQKAIQDIIANIIESGIIEFNKKTNPLFGMIQATGLDKQIKSFINLFLPNFLPKIADFLHTTSFGPSSTLSKDIAYIILNAPFSELCLPDEVQLQIAEDKLGELLDQANQDKKLDETIKNFSNQLHSKFIEKYGSITLIDFLNATESDFSQFNSTLSQYLTTEFMNYNKNNAIDGILTEIVSDIMNA